jgi:glycosyltransferase involved in cell wall biosynthesis
MKDDRPSLYVSGSEWFSSRPGGLNRYFQGYSAAMRDHTTWHVEAVAFGEAPYEGFRSRGDAGRGWPYRIARTLREAWRARRYSVYDSHFAPYGLPALMLRRVLKMPSIVHFHGPWAEESRNAGPAGFSVRVKRVVEKVAYRSANHCIVLSEAFKDLLHLEYGIPRAKITVIPGATDVRATQSVPRGQNDTKRVLCVRRLEWRMGIGTLLAAWHEISAGDSAARLDIVGTGSIADELHRYVRDHGLQDTVTFHGRAPDELLSELYSAAIVSVVPSIALEGFGLAVLESLARGTPVVATDCGGMPEILRPIDPTLVVPIEDAHALAARLLRALQGDIPPREVLVEAARGYSWTRLVQAHAALLDLATAK